MKVEEDYPVLQKNKVWVDPESEHRDKIFIKDMSLSAEHSD
jgi:hypothetical protein